MDWNLTNRKNSGKDNMKNVSGHQTKVLKSFLRSRWTWMTFIIIIHVVLLCLLSIIIIVDRMRILYTVCLSIIFHFISFIIWTYNTYVCIYTLQLHNKCTLMYGCNIYWLVGGIILTLNINKNNLLLFSNSGNGRTLFY